jgi:hypothetical protein
MPINSKKDAVYVENAIEFKDLMKRILQSTPNMLTIYFSIDAAKKAAKVCPSSIYRPSAYSVATAI